MYSTIALFSLMLMVVFLPSQASAHCDTMDGPVIAAAKKALDAGNANLVLIWVKPDDEKTIREAFASAVAARREQPENKNASDLRFFEKLVEIHRAGEGVAYAGIKPTGTEINPAVAAADKALESGSTEVLENLLSESIKKGIGKVYEEVNETKNYNPDDVEAGRDYVKSYVEFAHFSEKLYEMAENPAAVHGAEKHGSEGAEEGLAEDKNNVHEVEISGSKQQGNSESKLVLAKVGLYALAVLSLVLGGLLIFRRRINK